MKKLVLSFVLLVMGFFVFATPYETLYGEPGGGLFASLLPFAIIIALFYFLYFISQQKRKNIEQENKNQRDIRLVQ